MRLTEEQIKIVIEKLSKTAPNGIICPVCGNKRWNVNNTISEVREFQNGSIILGGNSSLIPIINITCQNCAHTLFFNALQMGLINREGETINDDKDGRK